jgi:tRNA A-37 threonylcarbamoyl transferase component Bud32
VLDRYRLIEQIGSGGYGTVWIARDQERRCRVALKRIVRSTDDALERPRIEREGRAASRLAHPAIVRLLDTGEDAGAHYIVSELIEGSSLATLYRAGGVSDRLLLEIGAALADGLEHAHARGVVHRDVKPQNVLVPSHRAPGAAPAKLTDFGIARIAGEHSLTATGDVIGTFEYMAPEQAQGASAGPPADLYSLALTLYEGFTGANPLRGESVAATALRIGTAVEPLANLREDLPPPLCAAIDRALAPAPSQRGSLAALRAALEHALSDERRRGIRRAGDRARIHPLALTPRGRALLSASSGGIVTTAALAGVLGVHSLAAAAVAGAAAAVVVALAAAVGWLLVGLAALAWLGARGQPGSALLVCAALAPVAALLASRPRLWSAPAAGPLLAALGVAACAPAIAGLVGGRAPARATLGALSYWWLAIVEALVGRRLLFGAPAHVLARARWQGSLTGAFQHALIPLLTDRRLATAALWAAAAVALPWIVRGAGARARAVGALAWAALLVGGAMVLATRLGLPRPASPVAAFALAAALAAAGRGLRARSHGPPDVA